MYNAKVNSEKGVTLSALVTYIVIMIIIIAIMANISSFFFKNVYSVIDTPKYLSETNKFIMFFATDVKNYKNVTVASNILQFENGPIYKVKDNYIYRNNVPIAKYIMNCTFSNRQLQIGNITKNIVTVNMQVGNNDEKSIAKKIDFTLKYW